MTGKSFFAVCLVIMAVASSCLTILTAQRSDSAAGLGSAQPFQASQWRGFPDADPDSGRFLGAAGNGLSTLAGQLTKLIIGIPAGRTSFTIGIFDGEGNNSWDQYINTIDLLDFKLYKDPLKNGAMTLMDSWNNLGMFDDGWTDRTYTTSNDAKAPSGNYFYRLEINWNDPTTADDINGFKVRVDGQVGAFAYQPYCVEGAPIAVTDPLWGMTDPNPGDYNDPGVNSYRGNWQFYFYVPRKVPSMKFQDGDFDRADDTDDANTPNIDPDGPGPAIAEGVNPGAPPDDPLTPTSYTIPPSVNYSITEPSGSIYLNTNPSGNQEWENFIISTNVSDQPDYLVGNKLEPGLWKLQFIGVDAHNLACLSVPYEVYTYDEPPLPLSPPPTVDPDRSAAISVPPPQTLTFAHTVTNHGPPQVFDLDATSQHGWVTRIYHDLDGDGVLDVFEPMVSDTGMIGQNATFKIIVQVDVPNLGSFTVDVTTTLASSQTEWAVQGSAEDTITVNTNRAPKAEAGGPYTGYEGSAVVLDGSGSTDPDNNTLQFRWDFANDGTWDTPWSLNPKTPHTWGDDYTGKVALQITDGNLTDIDTASVTILDVLPSGSLTIISQQHEGSAITFAAHVTDPGSDDLFLRWTWGYGAADEYSTYYNNGVGPDPYPSPDINPRDITDTKSHTYGDNGAFVVTVFVRDDDSGTQGITLQITATPDNLPPTVDFAGDMTVDEGQSVTLTATATDPGSDDLTFSWAFELGPSIDDVYYNDGIGPDPSQSPGGTYPFTATDTATHVYGDDGVYTVTLTVTDDDGGSVTSSAQVMVMNLPPTITPFGPFEINEADLLSVTANAVDPGSDDLTFTWTFEYGPTIQDVFYNDGVGPDPVKSPDGMFPFSVDDMASHVYGDNGVFVITLTVTDDDGGMATYQTTVTVLNIPPTIVDAKAYLLADVTLMISGEKWHDVILRLFEDGQEVGYAQVIRYPGSPSEQSMTLHDVEITLTGQFSAVAYYTPSDDPINGQPNGADPAWIIITWEDGRETTLKHNFNVMAPDRWIWTVDNLYLYAANEIVHVKATATDPGSDDLTFTWDWGDGTPSIATTYFNDGIGPDPYPSPDGTYPFTATDSAQHIYAMAGDYSLTLTVMDDDGGMVNLVIVLVIP
jgi:hypothetical protein